MSKRNCFFLFWRFDYAALGLAEAVSQYYRSSLQTVIMKRMTIENQKLLLLKRHAFFLVWKVENSNSFILFRGRVMICEELGQRGQGGLSTANAKRKRLMGIHCIRSHEKLLVLCYLGWHQPNSCLAGLTVKPFIAFFLPPVGTVVVVVSRTWSALNL